MIKKSLRAVVRYLNTFGFDVIKMLNSLRGLPSFIKDYIKLKKEVNSTLFTMKLYPILDDKYKQGGTAKGHYFHQDLLVAQRIFQSNPTRHIDIGSRVDGFIAHLATFRKVEVIDIRDTKSNIYNIEFLQADMMLINENLLECCDSLSCLHALEHFGLGRYGDPIDIDGHLKGFHNMHKILKPHGTFYLSVPIGHQRIEFNAHRVFSLHYLFKMFKDKFTLIHFHFVDDNGDLHKNVNLTDEEITNNYGCSYGCGIFELRKIEND